MFPAAYFLCMSQALSSVRGCTCSGCRRQGVLPTWGVEFERFVAGAGAPPDKEIGSDAAGRHPASPLVAGALDAIIRGNRVREGGRLLVVFSVVSLSRSSGEGVLMARASSMMAGEVDAAVAAIDVLRSCCWAGIGLLGAVTGVGWELGVP